MSCIGVTDGTRRFVFDATPDFPSQVHSLGARVPDGVFLTHAHIGHYTGLVHLGKEVAGTRHTPLYATPPMHEFIAGNAPWRALVENGNVAPLDNSVVDLGKGLTVTAFNVPHRNEWADTVGYRISGPRASALFIPDIDSWSAWREDLAAAVRGVDYAFVDGTFFSGEELPGRDMATVPHPLISTTMDLLADTGLASRVHFIHINHSNPVLENPTLVTGRGFNLAFDGQRLAL